MRRACVVSALVALLAGSAVATEPIPGAEDKNCTTTFAEAASARNLQAWSAALQLPGMSDLLPSPSAEGGNTFFAPLDSALVDVLAVYNVTMEEAMGQVGRLAALMLYNAIPGSRVRESIEYIGLLQSLLGIRMHSEDYFVRVLARGANLQEIVLGGNVTKNEARLLDKFEVCGSLVYVVDQVLLPTLNLTALPDMSNPAVVPPQPPSPSDENPPAPFMPDLPYPVDILAFGVGPLSNCAVTMVTDTNDTYHGTTDEDGYLELACKGTCFANTKPTVLSLDPRKKTGPHKKHTCIDRATGHTPAGILSGLVMSAFPDGENQISPFTSMFSAGVGAMPWQAAFQNLTTETVLNERSDFLYVMQLAGLDDPFLALAGNPVQALMRHKTAGLGVVGFNSVLSVVVGTASNVLRGFDVTLAGERQFSGALFSTIYEGLMSATGGTGGGDLLTNGTDSDGMRAFWLKALEEVEPEELGSVEPEIAAALDVASVTASLLTAAVLGVGAAEPDNGPRWVLNSMAEIVKVAQIDLAADAVAVGGGSMNVTDFDRKWQMLSA